MSFLSYPGGRCCATLGMLLDLIVSWLSHLYNELVWLGLLLFLCQIVMSVQRRALGYDVIAKGLRALCFLDTCWCLVLVYWAKPFVLYYGIRKSLKHDDPWKRCIMTQSCSSKKWKWMTAKGDNAGQCPEGLELIKDWGGSSKCSWFILVLPEVDRS